jgi:hypothetical protein
MKFFMQHVGENLSRRDFPRSIGTPDKLCIFTFEEIDSWDEFRVAVPDNDRESLSREPIGWQIWGLPDGAYHYTSQMFRGDALMLLGSEKQCEYVGTIDYRVPTSSPGISRRIWKESRFAQIVLLKDSQFIDLRWADFISRIGYNQNYRLQGATSRVSDGKLRSSGFSDAGGLEEWVRSFGRIPW